MIAFQTEGSLPGDFPLYVVREADAQLYRALSDGKFCYVLNTRQMGKSSLMVRTVSRLVEDGVRCAIIDLTTIGTELKQSEWYAGIVFGIARGLGLPELMATWADTENLSGPQRLVEVLRAALARTGDRCVILVDEIDTTLKLPFTDDFFAAIRSCFNLRATEPDFKRLTFALFGVASPSDLIKNPQLTPFNIGTRIELDDFSRAQLVEQFGAHVSEAALARVWHWTAGHPYLTHKLVAEAAAGSLDAAGVDARVAKSLLELDVRDSNIEFVRDRLSDPRAMALVELYGAVRAGKKVVSDERSALQNELKLTGAVVARDGRLKVRNRIYERIFDSKWVRRRLPAKKSSARLLALSLVPAAAAVAGVLLYQHFYSQPRSLERTIAVADTDDEAPQVLEYASRLRGISGYARRADVALAAFWDRASQQREARGELEAALLLRLRAISVEDLPDRRAEAGRLAAQLDGLARVLRFPGKVLDIAPDLASAVIEESNGLRIWSLATHHPASAFLRMPERKDPKAPAEKKIIFHARYSPDGARVVTEEQLGSTDVGRLQLWDARSGQPIGEPFEPGFSPTFLWSNDGRWLSTVSFGRMRVYDRDANSILDVDTHDKKQQIANAGFSLDRPLIWGNAYDEKGLRRWDLNTRKPLGSYSSGSEVERTINVFNDGTSRNGRFLLNDSIYGLQIYDNQQKKKLGPVACYDKFAISDSTIITVQHGWLTMRSLPDLKVTAQLNVGIASNELVIRFDEVAKQLYVGDADAIRVWKLKDAAEPELQELAQVDGDVVTSAVRSDGQRVAIATRHELVIVEPGSGAARLVARRAWPDWEHAETPLSVKSLAWAKDPERVLIVTGRGPVLSLEPGSKLGFQERVVAAPVPAVLTVGPDGHEIVVCDFEKCTPASAGSATVRLDRPLTQLAVSRDGVFLAGVDTLGRLMLYRRDLNLFNLVPSESLPRAAAPSTGRGSAIAFGRGGELWTALADWGTVTEWRLKALPLTQPRTRVVGGVVPASLWPSADEPDVAYVLVTRGDDRVYRARVDLNAQGRALDGDANELLRAWSERTSLLLNSVGKLEPLVID